MAGDLSNRRHSQEEGSRGRQAQRPKRDEAIMSALTYSHDTLTTTAVGAEVGARKPLWRRMADAMIAGQQRRAEREIARYLANRGGLFTDDMEREIMRGMSGQARRAV
jgi:hypothetical protein